MSPTQETSMQILLIPRSKWGRGLPVKVRKLRLEDQNPQSVGEKRVFPRGWRLNATLGVNVTDSEIDGRERFSASVPKLPNGLAEGLGKTPGKAVRDLGEQLVVSYNELVPGMSLQTLTPELLTAATLLDKKIKPPPKSIFSLLSRRRTA